MINEDLPNPINQTLFQLSIFRFEISESFFAILWQRNARRPRDSGPCRSEARLQSWDLVWALPLPLPLQALHKSASAFRPCKFDSALQSLQALLEPNEMDSNLARQKRSIPFNHKSCICNHMTYSGDTLQQRDRVMLEII